MTFHVISMADVGRRLKKIAAAHPDNPVFQRAARSIKGRLREITFVHLSPAHRVHASAGKLRVELKPTDDEDDDDSDFDICPSGEGTGTWVGVRTVGRPVQRKDCVELTVHSDRAGGMWFPVALDSFDFFHELEGYLRRITAVDSVLGDMIGHVAGIVYEWAPFVSPEPDSRDAMITRGLRFNAIPAFEVTATSMRFMNGTGETMFRSLHGLTSRHVIEDDGEDVLVTVRQGSGGEEGVGLEIFYDAFVMTEKGVCFRADDAS